MITAMLLMAVMSSLLVGFYAVSYTNLWFTGRLRLRSEAALVAEGGLNIAEAFVSQLFYAGLYDNTLSGEPGTNPTYCNPTFTLDSTCVQPRFLPPFNPPYDTSGFSTNPAFNKTFWVKQDPLNPGSLAPIGMNVDPGGGVTPLGKPNLINALDNPECAFRYLDRYFDLPETCPPPATSGSTTATSFQRFVVWPSQPVGRGLRYKALVVLTRYARQPTLGELFSRSVTIRVVGATVKNYGQQGNNLGNPDDCTPGVDCPDEAAPLAMNCLNTEPQSVVTQTVVFQVRRRRGYADPNLRLHPDYMAAEVIYHPINQRFERNESSSRVPDPVPDPNVFWYNQTLDRVDHDAQADLIQVESHRSRPINPNPYGLHGVQSAATLIGSTSDYFLINYAFLNLVGRPPNDPTIFSSPPCDPSKGCYADEVATWTDRLNYRVGDNLTVQRPAVTVIQPLTDKTVPGISSCNANNCAVLDSLDPNGDGDCDFDIEGSTCDNDLNDFKPFIEIRVGSKRYNAIVTGIKLLDSGGNTVANSVQWYPGLPEVPVSGATVQGLAWGATRITDLTPSSTQARLAIPSGVDISRYFSRGDSIEISPPASSPSPAPWVYQRTVASPDPSDNGDGTWTITWAPPLRDDQGTEVAPANGENINRLPDQQWPAPAATPAPNVTTVLPAGTATGTLADPSSFGSDAYALVSPNPQPSLPPPTPLPVGAPQPSPYPTPSDPNPLPANYNAELWLGLGYDWSRNITGNNVYSSLTTPPSWPPAPPSQNPDPQATPAARPNWWFYWPNLLSCPVATCNGSNDTQVGASPPVLSVLPGGRYPPFLVTVAPDTTTTGLYVATNPYHRTNDLLYTLTHAYPPGNTGPNPGDSLGCSDVVPGGLVLHYLWNVMCGRVRTLEPLDNLNDQSVTLLKEETPYRLRPSNRLVADFPNPADPLNDQENLPFQRAAFPPEMGMVAPGGTGKCLEGACTHELNLPGGVVDPATLEANDWIWEDLTTANWVWNTDTGRLVCEVPRGR